MAKHSIYLGVAPDVNPRVYIDFLKSRIEHQQVYISAEDHAVYPLLPRNYTIHEAWNYSEGYQERILTELQTIRDQAVVCLMDIRCFTVVLNHFLQKPRSTEIGLEFNGKIVLYSHDLERFCKLKKLQMRITVIPKTLSEEIKDITDRVKTRIIGPEMTSELMNMIGNKVDFMMETRLNDLGEEFRSLERYANHRFSQPSSQVPATLNRLKAAQTQMERINQTLLAVKSALETGEGERRAVEDEIKQLDGWIQQFSERILHVRNLCFREEEQPVHLMLLPDQRLLAINFKREANFDVILYIETAEDSVQDIPLVWPLRIGPQILDCDLRQFEGFQRVKILLKTEHQILSNTVEVSTQNLNPRIERREISYEESDLVRSEAFNKGQSVLFSYQDQPSFPLNSAVSPFEDSYPPLLPPSADLRLLILPEEQQLFQEIQTAFPDLSTTENLPLRFLAAARCAGNLENKDRIVMDLLGIE